MNLFSIEETGEQRKLFIKDTILRQGRKISQTKNLKENWKKTIKPGPLINKISSGKEDLITSFILFEETFIEPFLDMIQTE